VQTEAQKLSFERNGYDEYEFIALDTACKICKAINGKRFKVKDMMPGENAPPMHPRCRCSTAAYMDRNEFERWLSEKDEMKLSIPDEIYAKSGMSSKTRNKINQAIHKLEQEYNVYLDRLEGGHLGTRDLFISGGFVDNDGVLKHSIVFNYDIDYEEVERRMKLMYNKKQMAGKSFEDYLAHEFAHILPFQNCVTAEEYQDLRNDLKNQFVSGVSGYADRSRDGAESLAEAFVRYRNGEEIPDESRELIQRYITPWRR